MKEIPILFSAPMVRALLAGTKTQTRRAWRDQPPAGVRVAYVPGQTRSPYGQPGDRLWVREAFAFTDAHEPRYMGSIEYRADNKCMAVDHGPVTAEAPHKCDPRPFDGPWKPSIHMPRWASRITLEVTEVRVERLQDISEADARAEGADFINVFDGLAWHTGHRAGFEALWWQINGPGSWEANPWVWAVSFKRVAP